MQKKNKMLKLRANTAKKNKKRNLLFHDYIFVSLAVQESHSLTKKCNFLTLNPQFMIRNSKPKYRITKIVKLESIFGYLYSAIDNA